MEIAFQSDLVTLYHGDCLEVMPSLPAGSIDLIWCDPPYGHSNHDGDWNSALNEHRGIEQQPIANDTADEMRVVVSGMLDNAVRVLKKESSCCCCCCGGGGPKPTFAWLANRMDSDGLSFFHSVIWDKINPGLGWCYRRQHEMVMVSQLKGGKLRWPEKKKAIPNVMRVSKSKVPVHPNEKPLELISNFIRVHSLPGDTVLDPFSGGGNTLLAAITMGRKAIGIEIDAKWCDVIKGRLEEWHRQPRFEEAKIIKPVDTLFDIPSDPVA